MRADTSNVASNNETANIASNGETITEYAKGTAASKGIASCHVCNQLNLSSLTHCTRCNGRLHLRYPNSIQRTLALVFTAFLLYIPANLYPIMTTTLLGDASPSTIISGVILFIDHGSYFVAFVIFAASILIPIAKMLVIIWLCYATTRPTRLSELELTRMYRATEFIGKWSMVDIFVVAILVALVQVSGLMSIEPGLAARAFALVVILTMVAALQFDVRLIWDRQKQQ
jgi:paraquat-inducible protein A